MRRMAARLVASTVRASSLPIQVKPVLRSTRVRRQWLVGAEDGVTLQVADAGTVLGTGRPLGDGPLPGEPAAGLS